ncbi:MAG TPA: hypothetical protein VF950_17050 [Planctomycetota bacterium]
MTLAALLLLSLQGDIQTERATLLRRALKPHAAFRGVEAGRIALRVEGEAEDRAWPLDPEAEIRVKGYWGAVEDLVPGERVWVWARVDAENKPRAVFMVADEISEQDIHQVPWALTAVDPGRRTIELRRKLDGKTEQVRTVRVPPAMELPAAASAVYVQTAGGDLVRLADAAALAALKEAQKARLDERRAKTGLPGTVTALHLLSGEIEVALDHEAIRRGRAFKPGDRATLHLDKPFDAAQGRPVPVLVQEIRPWYERTRLTLVSNGRDLADVLPGRRVGVSPPAGEPGASRLPPDAERPREPAARAEWMLASTYCSCSIAGDVCTGMFYTLAACNGMTCGMPKRVRGFVGPLIEKGLTDREIFEKMEAELGPAIWKPHLLR